MQQRTISSSLDRDGSGEIGSDAIDSDIGSFSVWLIEITTRLRLRIGTLSFRYKGLA